jgi:hypothetical protein
MDNAQNCDSYINVPSSKTYRSHPNHLYCIHRRNSVLNAGSGSETWNFINYSNLQTVRFPCRTLYNVFRNYVPGDTMHPTPTKSETTFWVSFWGTWSPLPGSAINWRREGAAVRWLPPPGAPDHLVQRHWDEHKAENIPHTIHTKRRLSSNVVVKL